MKIPKVKRVPYSQEIHGDVREDDYYWLKDRENPEVIEYLEAENEYYDEVMRPLEEQTKAIFKQLIDRVPESEEEVPVQHGPYFYYSKKDKSKQYPIHVRKKAENRTLLEGATEEVLLDLNELIGEDDYLSVTAQRITNDGNRLAYLENRDGTDRYNVYIKELSTGELLGDKIPNVFIYGSIEWSSCGNYIFYITVDEHQRPSQLWRHKIGEEIGKDELLYEEKDDTFTLYIDKSQSGKYIFVQSFSTTTSEARLIDADAPLSALQLVDERKKGVLYDVEHWEDELLILTDEDALNFKLLRCPLDDFGHKTTVIDYNENRFLQGIHPFKNELYVSGREDGLTEIWKLEGGQLNKIEWDEPIYSVSVIGDQDYNAEEMLIQYESSLTPTTTYGIDLATNEMKRIKVERVSGEFDVSNYEQEQIWATAEDGVKVPLIAVYRKGALDKGPAPTVLYGYGSYGANSDPYFSPYLIPLLDEGVVFVVAQVRGGSEMGRGWYEDGKMEHKRNTFTDFIAAAQHLIDLDYTTANQLAARGGSAGGLLVGAVSNMAGDLFSVIVPEVPFVDVVTTMLDTSIPLTTLEWDEWGNPNKEDDYFHIKSYSPYDNVEAKDYPHMYVTTGINDPRVGYWEPAKWVARLRELKTDTNTLVMKTNMGAGHFGKSGRFDQLREVAELYAFVLDKIMKK